MDPISPENLSETVAEDAGRGPFIQTYTGRRVYPFDPRPEEIDIEDIAHALSNICRFTGHVSRFYSVAEHCWHCSKLVLTNQLYALLHDAAEAYMGDVSRPVKTSLHSVTKYGLCPFGESEERLETAIFQAFDLPAMPEDVRARVKRADERMLVAEAAQLMHSGDRGGRATDAFGRPWWTRGYWASIERPAKYGQPFGLSPETARTVFMERFYELYTA